MSIAKHHTDWRRLLDISGPFLSLPVLTKAFPHGLDPHEPEILERARLAYDEWRESQEGPRPDPLHRQWVRFVLQDVLGHPDEVLQEGQTIPQGLKVTAAEHHEELRPDLVIVNPTGKPGAGKPRLLVSVLPFGAELEKPLAGVRWKESPAGRMTILLRGLDVRLGLITNGEQWMLVDAAREETTGFTTWHAWLWLDEHVTLRAFRTLLGPSRFFNVPENATLEALLQESAERQQEVTDQLGRQVRRAVEILVQALDRSDRESSGKLLENTPEKEVYEAAVTFMMRLVFLFCAEERGLFPLDDEQYATHYAASTLSERLRDAAEQWSEEVLERRTDAWQRLLATFRAVHGGVEHEDMLLPPYGGDLFDPDRYPFLEGRPRGTRWRAAPAQPLPIHNRTVLHLLEALQLLQDRKTGEAQRLSFLHLDIEQIGHVYEGLLDHTVRRATEPVVSLKGREADEPEFELAELESLARERRLLEIVAERSDRSTSAVDADLRQAPEPEDEHHLLVAADNDSALYHRLRPFAGIIRHDIFGRPVVILRNSLFVTQGSDRRTTGTHYTPRSLTEPIVRYTLEPLAYDGPAEGTPKDQWELRTARDILSLKVCDMACGSGAFLVQACRYLSERLVESWEEAETRNPGRVVITPEGELSEARPTECIVPHDPEERLAVARRLVADRCLYGVDVNEMAVEMAKLSLWLVTLQKGRPFSFLNHAIKRGDSLLGLTDARQVGDFNLKPTGKTRRLFLANACQKALVSAEATRRRLEEKSVLDVRDAEAKALLLREADAAVAAVVIIGDLVIGLALAATRRQDTPADRKEIDRLISEAFDEAQPAETRRSRLVQLRESAQLLLRRLDAAGRRAFHWPLEFPEVFAPADEGQCGFHAFLGNPPFMGGLKLETAFGADYRAYLVEHIGNGEVGIRGTGDLCAYFFLRAADLLRTSGMAGLLATNTIAQGDTRQLGLGQLFSRQFTVPRAVPSRSWPGDASIEVAHVWFRKALWAGAHFLDDLEVAGIGPYLSVPGRIAGTPFRLASNTSKAFQGSNVLGLGFLLTPEDAAELRSRDPRNHAVVVPYLNGEDLNSQPDQTPRRWVISFRDWPLDRGSAAPGYLGPVASEYADCLALVRARVKPERDKYPPTSAWNRSIKARWWQFAAPRFEMIAAIEGLSRVLVRARIANLHSVCSVPAGWVYNEKTIVFANVPFVVLQSSIHEIWARRYSSTLRNDLQYTPSACLETFPFCADAEDFGALQQRYEDHRRELMVSRREGLTRTYNRFHDPAERSAGIQRLRDLHCEVDLAVVRTYGWTDLILTHGFEETKQGERFTLNESVRQEILDRLLELNHKRHAEEVASGQREASKPKKTRRRKAGDGGLGSKSLLDALDGDQ